MPIKNNAHLPIGWRVCTEMEAEKFGEKKFVGVVLIRDGMGLVIHETDKFHWRVCGGGARPNERLRQAAAREVMEEIGLAIDINKLIFIVGYINMDYTHVKSFYGYKLNESDSLIVTAPALDEDENIDDCKIVDLRVVNKEHDISLSLFHKLAIIETTKKLF
jgi:ADP-ribose pyrophosphatase YjhB (NUDIX family)